MMNARHVARALAIAALACLVFLAAPAQAHVLLDAVRPHGDGTVDLVFSFDHGCVGQVPTDELTLTIPDHTAVLGAAEPAGWSHRVADGTVTWTGPGIPDGKRAEFVVTARVGARPGETVLFPVVQACQGAEPYEWTAPADDAQYPAPRFVATSATVDPSLTPAPAQSAGGGAGPVAVGAAIAVLVGGAAAITARERRRRPTNR